jgi:Glycosyltransferase family 87
MWVYVGRVLVPQQKADAASQGVPRGNLSDLYPRWLGSRELLLGHRDPYSPEITREIQAGYYGRPLNRAIPGSNSNEPRDQQAFAYPVYVAFLLAPTVKLPFSQVQAVSLWFLAGLTAFSVLVWMRFVMLRLSWATAAILLPLTLGTFAAVQGIRLQQLSLLVAALIAISAYLLLSNRQVLAGILLALATIKPQMALPLAAWLLLWAFSRLQSRWRFAAAFAITLAVLIVEGEYLLPGWMTKFCAALIVYRQYTGGHSLLDQLATPVIGIPLAALVVAAVATICWHDRDSSAYEDDFRWTTSLVLAATVVIVPTVAPYNQLLLFPGTLLLLRTWPENLRMNAAAGVLGALAVACVVWPWISATGLALVSLFTSGAQRFWQLPLWTSLFIPIPITAYLVLLRYRRNPPQLS